MLNIGGCLLYLGMGLSEERLSESGRRRPSWRKRFQGPDLVLDSLRRQFCHGAERRTMTRPNALDRCRVKLLTHSLVHSLAQAERGRKLGSLAESYLHPLTALLESDGKARLAAFTEPEAE